MAKTKKDSLGDVNYLLEKARQQLKSATTVTKKTKASQASCDTCGAKPVYMKKKCKKCYEEYTNLKEAAAVGKKWISTDGIWRIYGPGMKVMLYHRYRMEQILGRPLESHEQVIFIDGNKENINDDNFLLILKTGIDLTTLKCSHCEEPYFKKLAASESEPVS